MHKRGLTVALVAVLTLIFVFGAVGVAFAQWTDLTMSILGDYGITEQQVANISDGFPDGSWQPYQAMPRNQFVKMAVDAYQIPLVTPATPTYSDVPTTDYYYSYIEGATAAGLTNGVGGGKFEPNTIITREQAVAIISRWVADKNGYDLETMYTDADAAAILSVYPDASEVGPSLVKEMAFAVDFGIVWGTDSGDLAPKLNMSRIQGAAMLIRSLDIIPLTEPVVPVKIELVSDDEAENLIGLTHQYTYKVTQADGSPAPGILVDFDTLMAPTYVGNVQPEAALTDENGEATVNLISTEVGIQRVSAAAPGVAAIWSTKYWLALDEVYILDHTRTSQNNAGTTHTWEARVVVFGPGPLSTSANDWYNAYLPAGDPADADEMDGVDWPYGFVVDAVNSVYQNLLPLDLSEFDDYDALLDWVDEFITDHSDAPQSLIDIVNTLAMVDRWSFDTEQIMIAHGYKPRTMADIPVLWEIAPLAVLDDPDTTADESVASVGTIVAATEDGEIAADGQSAWAKTNADGISTIDITSEKTGATPVSVRANYEGNPYEWQLFSHWSDLFDTHFADWDDQPMPQATAWKTWIPHIIGGEDTPISPAFTEANVGEEFTLTLTLKDVYGNAVTGKQVEWTMQGIGYFITDDDNTVSDPDDPAGNKDIDVTDAAGTARLMVKSLDPGEQIVHAKVRDKGIGGNEGIFGAYTAEVQYFDVDVATFDDPTTDGKATGFVGGLDGGPDTSSMPVDGVTSDLAHNDFSGWIAPKNEALSTNTVGTDHVFTINVMGLKLEYDPYLELEFQGDNWTPPWYESWYDNEWMWYNQTPFIDTDAAGSSYDGVFDAKDAAYLGGIMLIAHGYVGPPENPTSGPLGAYPEWPVDVDQDGVIDDNVFERGTHVVVSQGEDLIISGVGGYTRYDWDMDGYKETFGEFLGWDAPPAGIYLPLEGKDVTFALEENYLGKYFTEDDIHDSVGSFAPPSAVTDENGQASVTVSSDQKGPETISGTVDWEGNPHNMGELIKAYAKKIWVADTADKIVVSIDGEEVANNVDGEVLDALVNPAVVLDENFDADNPEWFLEADNPYSNPETGLAPGSAHIETHVYDSSGNELPDYEVVYLLEDAGNWFEERQGTQDTYLPYAFFEDADPENFDEDTEMFYDTNGTRPDSDEPLPEDDPYAPIVGDGGTDAFFFNQWLGASFIEPGAPWFDGPKNTDFGQGFFWWDYDPGNGSWNWEHYFTDIPPKDGPYFDDYGLAFGRGQGSDADGQWVGEDINGLDYYAGLLTDGAKTWTRDGYFRPINGLDNDGQPLGYGDVFPNLLTGSHVDLQLAEMLTSDGNDHYKSIVKVLVYAPADGLVTDKAPIWEYQIHKVWEAPEVTTINLTPATDIAIAGLESTTLTAEVLDQFGLPMFDVDVDFTYEALEGSLSNTGAATGTTDVDGKVNVTWNQNAGDWGVQQVVASANGVDSNKSTIQWVYQDGNGAFSPDDLISAFNTETHVNVYLGFALWNTQSLQARSAPESASLGSGTYNQAIDLSIPTLTKTWATGDRFYVYAPNSSNTDEKPNWVTDVVNVD